MSENQIEYTSMPIADLQPHPLQQLYYPPETATDDEALRADIEAHGLREDVVVLPPNENAGLAGWTIADGHRRVAIAKELGWESINVLIRHDLADADAETVEQEFLRYNFSRRQLHMLDQARIALRLHAIETGRSRDELRPHEEPEARDRVAQRLGMTGRNLARYWRVLRCPKPIQDAVRDERLGLALGERIAGLPAATQKRLAARIAKTPEGKQVTTLVRNELQKTTTRERTVWTSVRRLVRDLDHHLYELEDEAERLADFELVKHVDVLERGHRMLATLAAKATNPQKSKDEVFEEVATHISRRGPLDDDDIQEADDHAAQQT